MLKKEITSFRLKNDKIECFSHVMSEEIKSDVSEGVRIDNVEEIKS